MRQRLLALCLLAYPRSRRDRDGDYLRDLALELADRSGVLRQAFSLLRGGLLARWGGVRRWTAPVVVAVVAGLVAIGGVALAAERTAEIEVQSCSGHDCAGLEGWAAGRERDGWHCQRTSSPGPVSWQCVRP